MRNPSSEGTAARLRQHEGGHAEKRSCTRKAGRKSPQEDKDFLSQRHSISSLQEVPCMFARLMTMHSLTAQQLLRTVSAQERNAHYDSSFRSQSILVVQQSTPMFAARDGREVIAAEESSRMVVRRHIIVAAARNREQSHGHRQ